MRAGAVVVTVVLCVSCKSKSPQPRAGLGNYSADAAAQWARACTNIDTGDLSKADVETYSGWGGHDEGLSATSCTTPDGVLYVVFGTRTRSVAEFTVTSGVVGTRELQPVVARLEPLVRPLLPNGIWEKLATAIVAGKNGQLGVPGQYSLELESSVGGESPTFDVSARLE